MSDLFTNTLEEIRAEHPGYPGAVLTIGLPMTLVDVVTIMDGLHGWRLKPPEGDQ